MLERAKHVKSGGVVFRLYSRRRVEGFLAYDIPEINRISLVRTAPVIFLYCIAHKNLLESLRMFYLYR